jgi:hypothetical protein
MDLEVANGQGYYGHIDQFFYGSYKQTGGFDELREAPGY